MFYANDLKKKRREKLKIRKITQTESKQNSFRRKKTQQICKKQGRTNKNLNKKPNKT